MPTAWNPILGRAFPRSSLKERLMPITRFVANPPSPDRIELPAKGFPFAEEALREWFRGKYHREASCLEMGTLMSAMAARDDARGDPPATGQTEPSNELWGWRVEPVAGADP